MKISITDIEQSYSLKDGNTVNYAVVELPSGKKSRFVIDDEMVAEIIAESTRTNYGDGPREGEAASVEDAHQHEFFTSIGPEIEHTPIEAVEQYEHHVEAGAVEWEKLPDTQLPPSMKQIMRTAKLNPIISADDLETIKASILQKMGKTAKPGKVDWQEGTRRQVDNRPRRTVPMDDAGNPLPPGGIMEADPGEGPDEDDGVDQA